MELLLISGFCSVKRMRVFDSPGQDTNPLQVSSQHYAGTHLPTPKRMESLGGKEGHTNIPILAEPGSNWGPYGRKAEILQLHQLCPPKERGQ